MMYIIITLLVVVIGLLVWLIIAVKSIDSKVDINSAALNTVNNNIFANYREIEELEKSVDLLRVKIERLIELNEILNKKYENFLVKEGMVLDKNNEEFKVIDE